MLGRYRCHVLVLSLSSPNGDNVLVLVLVLALVLALALDRPQSLTTATVDGTFYLMQALLGFPQRFSTASDPARGCSIG